MDMEHFNPDEWEIVNEPIPEHETPREFLLRLTGIDFFKDWQGPGLSWENVRNDPPLQDYLTKLLMRHSKTQVKLRKKEKL